MPWSGILGPVHLLYMQYVATEQLFSRSHREQQVGPQENKGTERYQKLVNGDVFTLGWKNLVCLTMNTTKSLGLLCLPSLLCVWRAQKCRAVP